MTQRLGEISGLLLSQKLETHAQQHMQDGDRGTSSSGSPLG